MNKRLKKALAEQKAQQALYAKSGQSPYFSDYENEPIGDGNPYWRCIHCKVSDPQINGQLANHLPNCAYRLKKQAPNPL